MENLKVKQMENLGEIKVVRTQSVYSTKKYNIFNISEINRSVKANNVNVIKNSILSEGQQKPIVVDDKMFIIDGQHRYSALKELNLPIEFVLSTRSGVTMKDKMSVMESQNTSFSWSTTEKLELRSKIDDNYLRLKNLVDEYGFSISTTCDILWNKYTVLQKKNTSNANYQTGFKENTMVVSEEMIDESNRRFFNFKKLYQINKIFSSSPVVRLIISLCDNQKLDINKLILKAENHKNRIENLYDSNNKFDFIDKLYNFSSKKPTYFIEPKKFRYVNNKNK